MIEDTLTTFSNAFLDTLILSTLENLKDNEYIAALTYLAAFLSKYFFHIMMISYLSGSFTSTLLRS